MTTFRFNFSGDNEDTKVSASDGEIKWMECNEIVPDRQIKDLDKIAVHAKMFTCHDVEIGHVVASEALANIGESGFKNAVELAENEHSDLVAGTYEGGLKIWECTHDLLEYLIENEEQIVIKGKRVLDLGCGAGILGIYAYINGAQVVFQDYNKEVLEYVTIPNVLLNIEEEDQRETEIKKCKFYSGDWESFNEKLHNDETFDIILTSETIYNECNYDKLLQIFKERLSKNGVVLVAAKTCYFGVGGGMRQFEQNVQKNKQLNCEVCWKSVGGIQREILSIRKVDNY